MYSETKKILQKLDYMVLDIILHNSRNQLKAKWREELLLSI